MKKPLARPWGAWSVAAFAKNAGSAPTPAFLANAATDRLPGSFAAPAVEESAMRRIFGLVLLVFVLVASGWGCKKKSSVPTRIEPAPKEQPRGDSAAP